MNEEKRQNIIKSLQETRDKRKSQRCFVLELKIDYSKLNQIQKNYLKMIFVESKWLYNYYLSQEDIFKASDKVETVITKDKDGNTIERKLSILPSKVKQSIFAQIKQNIVNLSKSKKKGNTVGKLKFKSDINSVEFNQYGNTHKIVKGKFRKKVQRISTKQLLKLERNMSI